MKRPKKNILSLLQPTDLPSNLTFRQRNIIQYINYGALFAAAASVLAGFIFFIIGINEVESYYWLLGSAFIYLTIPFINKAQYFELSKILALAYLTFDLVTWNLFVYDTPYYLIIPFIVANIFYNKFWFRIIFSLIFFSIYFLVAYEIPVSSFDYVFLDFMLFVFILVLMLFLEDNITIYEQKMSHSINDLKSENKNLTKQHQLKKSEQFFTSFFEHSQLGFVIIDEKGRIINTNQTFRNQLEQSENELLDTYFIGLSQSQEAFNKDFEKLIVAEIKYFQLKTKFIKSDATYLIAELMINGVYNNEGNFVEAIITVQDVTTATEANERLKESEAKFKTFFEHSPLGITIRTADKERKLIDVNQVVLDKMGLTRAELLAIERDNLFPEHFDLEEDNEKVRQLLNGEISSISDEVTFDSKMNQKAYVEMTRIKIVVNGVVCIMAVLQDVTQRKIFEKERNSLFKETQIFFDAIPISFVYVDTNHKILRVNKVVQNNFEMASEGKYLTDIFPKFKERMYLHKDVINSGVAVIDKVEKIEVHGNIYWHKVSRIPVKDEHGIVKGLMIFSIDITAIKDAEAAVVLKNAELERYIETNLQLESFAYIASHDLKEPLRMIYSFTQLLNRKLKPYFDKEAEEYMQFILSGTQRMQNLLDDLLEYSTIGKQEHDIKIIDLNEIIYNVIQNLQLTIQEKNAEIKVDKLPSLKVFPVQMMQLFQNLISNALKFVAISRKPIINIKAIEDENNYIFSIQDNGIGIEKAYSEKIFLVFKRLHGKTDYEGTGIGLATCKKIVENHKGKIWLNSELGIGTTFYFTIPKSVDE